MPTEMKFQVSLLSPGGWGVRVGAVGVEIKANSAQLKLELGLSLAINRYTDTVITESLHIMFGCLNKHLQW